MGLSACNAAMSETGRTTKDAVEKRILDGIRRIAKADAMAARAPEPAVAVRPEEWTPALVNDSALTQKTVAVFRSVLGSDHLRSLPPLMAGEDFSFYGREGVASFMFWLGTIDPARAAQARREGAAPPPSLHSDHYFPVPQPSIRTGVLAMSMATVRLMQPLQ